MTQPSQVPFDRRTEDVGNLVEFGHVNFCVPDQQQALAFYVMGLGLTRDPFINTGIDNAWINVGRCQFHLPAGPAQVLRGVVHLVMPDLPALLERLAAIAPRLAGSRFGFEPQRDAVSVRCPWGNRIQVHAPESGRFGRLLLGMPRIDLEVPPGAAAPIARFYREILATPATVASEGAVVFADVPIGIAEGLRFCETEGEFPTYDGHHIQVGIADFSGAHLRLRERGLITEESNRSQYRFKDIVDLESGAVLTTLEHEVRSMRHPMYARVLVNRDPQITNRSYARGHESLRWAMRPEVE